MWNFPVCGSEAGHDDGIPRTTVWNISNVRDGVISLASVRYNALWLIRVHEACQNLGSFQVWLRRGREGDLGEVGVSWI